MEGELHAATRVLAEALQRQGVLPQVPAAAALAPVHHRRAGLDELCPSAPPAARA